MRIHDFIDSCSRYWEKPFWCLLSMMKGGTSFQGTCKTSICYFMLFQFSIIPITLIIEYIFPIALPQSICEKHLISGNTKQRKEWENLTSKTYTEEEHDARNTFLISFKIHWYSHYHKKKNLLKNSLRIHSSHFHNWNNLNITKPFSIFISY